MKQICLAGTAQAMDQTIEIQFLTGVGDSFTPQHPDAPEAMKPTARDDTATPSLPPYVFMAQCLIG
jgi:hypothetical protein